MNKIKIGWYCPFSFSPLLKNEKVEPVKINWLQSSQGYLGTTKLCKKLSSITYSLNHAQCDGIVLMNCCNLSQYINTYLKLEFRNISFFLMELPRKKNNFFEERLFAEWQEIEIWINSLLLTNSFKNRSCPASTAVSSCNENPWCLHPSIELSDLKAMGKEQIKELLMNEVLCPRMVTAECERIVLENESVKDVIDSACIQQQYYTMV